jgi:hypothetical protein
MKKSSFCCLLLMAFTCINGLFADDCLGKADIGPVFLHIDVLESGHTIKKINMAGVKADGYVFLWKGVCLKPTILFGQQGHHNQLLSGGCGLGHYTPIGDKCSLTPSVGCNFTYFRTVIHAIIPLSPEISIPLRLKEKFHSVSPYVALDASYCFMKGWRLVGSYQYVWSRTNTKIKGLDDTKSHPSGSNYALMIEGDLNNKWSVNLGAAYNSSLTKEKHGLRGYGMRLGVAYWF